MSELQYLIVQTLDNEEKQFAEAALKDFGEVTVSGSYVRGYGDDNCVKVLRGKNLIVEQVPDWLSLNWLEPSDSPKAATLSQDSESEASALRNLATNVPEVCIIQFKGPVRSKWKEELEKLGAEFLSAKPDFAFKALFKGKSIESIESLEFVKRVVRFDPAERYQQLRKNISRAKEYIQQAAQEELTTPASDMSEIPAGMALGESIAKAAEEASESSDHSSVTFGVAEGGDFTSDSSDFGFESADPPAEWEDPQLTSFTDDVAFHADFGSVATSEDLPALLQYDVKTQLPDQVPQLAEALKADARVKDIQVGQYKIRFSCEEDSPVLKDLSEMTQMVSRIDPYIEPELTVNCVKVAIGIETADTTPVLPWNGNGVLVGVADSGVDDLHPDLKNPVAEVISRTPADGDPDAKGHGTHVCGIIAGDGTASQNKIRGVAPGARLIVQRLMDNQGKLSGIPLEMADLFQESYDKGVRVHNNSWGHKVDGRYSIDSYEVDQFVYDHPDFLVIFSAGNDGKQTENGQPTVDQFGRILLMSVRSPATAKNALAVGACCSSRGDGPFAKRTWKFYNPIFSYPMVSDEPVCGDPAYLAAFSSRGPSDDERIKPDLVAPGTVVVSARKSGSEEKRIYESSDQYQYMSGTSQAAPVVAGAAAIIREYFSTQHNYEPSAALMKATLINGTAWLPSSTSQMDVGQPNFHQGFGRLDLQQTLPNSNNADLRMVFTDVDRQAQGALNSSVAAKSQWVRKLVVESGLPLVVTLAWTDKPGHGLQQNLDLIVVKPDGSKILGNHLMQRPSWSPRDRRNNVQQVRIATPMPGTYSLHVTAYNTPFENQGFSVVATGKLATNLTP